MTSRTLMSSSASAETASLLSIFEFERPPLINSIEIEPLRSAARVVKQQYSGSPPLNLKPPIRVARVFSPDKLEMIELQRLGVLTRKNPGGPRGTMEAPGHPRGGVDLGKYERLLLSDDEEIAQEAVGILGEFGGKDEVARLGHILVPPSESVRGAAAAALGNLGGPEAVEYLKKAVRGPSPVMVRRQSFFALLEIITGGWDEYQMSNRKITLPKSVSELFEGLKTDPDLGDYVLTAMCAFT